MATTAAQSSTVRDDLRNLAIIAHVDHGKTTLVDALFRFTGALHSHQEPVERALDREDLERERGITILAKNTSIEFEGVRIQLVDTPGHADFGGEVERVLGMVDSVLLLVDAVEGVMPQTRFVLAKALARGLRPILVVNKMDRPQQRGDAVVDEVFDLLVELGASDEQLDFPVVFCSAKASKASTRNFAAARDLKPLLDTIVEHAAKPRVEVSGPLLFQAVTLGYDEFLGRLVIGRVERGRLERGALVARVPEQGAPERFRVTKLFGTRGLERVELDSARAGDIVIIAGGLQMQIEVGDTVCDPAQPEQRPRIAIDPPTIRVRVAPNTSPFAGREGRFLTSRQIGERLEREARSNISIRLEDTGSRDVFQVAGRGELQIAVLIEIMRREGFEFSVSRPEIITRTIEGRSCEPVEDVFAETPDSAAGLVLEKLAGRQGRLLSMEQRGERKLLRFVAPSRGLFGYRSEFLSDTRGEGVLHRSVRGYEPVTVALAGRLPGAIVASETGRTTPYALFHIQERATLFVPPGVEVYEGQIVGENRRSGDMVVNVCRAKKLSNVRAAGRDEATVVNPPRTIGIESALEWIGEDEVLEVTPASLRLRKLVLAANQRKSMR